MSAEAPVQRRPGVLLATAAVLLLLDQLSKAFLLRSLHWGETVPVLGTTVRLHLLRNTGAVFGLLPEAGGWLLLLALIGSALAILLAIRVSLAWPGSVGLGLLCGGAAGNLVDRIRLGGVVDFVDIGVGALRWPAFNAADLGIVVGALLFGLALLKVA